MNLVKERLSWIEQFESDVVPQYAPYEEYKENRLSEMWRSTRYSEKFFEYVYWLENRK